MMIARATFWKAFGTGVANRSEGDITEHVLVLEMFQQFQTLKLIQTNKPCLDVKTFCDDMCFRSLL